MTQPDQRVPVAKEEAHLSPEQKHRRKQRVLTQGIPSITRSISNALVQKNENIFFLTQPDGNVPLSENHGFGLYYHDCRYLNGYELKLADTPPTVLVSSAITGFSTIVELTNPEIEIKEEAPIERESVGIKWERILDGKQNILLDALTFHNYSMKEITFPISLSFRSHFEDIFSIRGLLQEQPGKILAPIWREDDLVLAYSGADELFRSLTIHFSPAPTLKDHTRVGYSITLPPAEKQEILVTLKVTETAVKSALQGHPGKGYPGKESPLPEVSPETVTQEFVRISQGWLQDQTTFDCKELLTREILNRSMIDLRTLRSSIDHSHFFAAGIPWFTTLFGRDSILTSLQMLAFNPEIAVQTLRLLAKYQAQQSIPWQDAQPGKILHEIRVGELAHLGEIPHTPYYGSIDATPLFLLLVSRVSAWTGNLDIFNELKPNIEAALNWIDTYGDSDGDGYVDYHSRSEHGLVNQGWKDSGTAIVNADGSLAQPPIALPEVQGLVYQAKMGIAKLFDQAGQPSRADPLRQQAADLRARFNRDFWSASLGTYVLALQAQGRPANVAASNAGQVLWTGIADPDKARQTVERLMAEDMFNGWGIRTLSSQEKRYNPTGYHLGTVWPFDNMLIAAGFRRYGRDEQALKLYTALLETALLFQEYRLPELFSGFGRAEYQVPVNYPVACHPQAWSAGSTPYLLTSLLGLVPDGFSQRLSIVRPLLPRLIGPIEVHNLKIADARVDLSFEPSDTGPAGVHVQKVEGNLDVKIVSDLGEYNF
jgi:glycogen debranching enzyme